MRSGGRTTHFCIRHALRKEFNCRHAEQRGQTLNCARAHVLRTPLDTLIPFQICAEQGGYLLLRQPVPFAQLADARGNEFE